MWELIEAGGLVMAAIGLLSVVALGLVVERLLTYRRAQTDTEAFFSRLEELLRLGRADEALTFCDDTPGLVPRTLRAGLNVSGGSTEDVKRVLVDEISVRGMAELERHLPKIATIGRASPLLGLLGTVLGMISMFGEISLKGPGDMGALAGGIKLALGTTAAGLLVAIPIMFLHAWLRSSVRDLELELYTSATRFLGLLELRKEISEPAAAPDMAAAATPDAQA